VEHTFVGDSDGSGFDVIIVGASFGGLAAAMELGGEARVLLVDREPVGAGQTSACATPLPVLERLELEESIEQVHPCSVFHLPDGGAHRLLTRYPFATFDYSRLCRLLFERTGAEFLQASVRGLAGPGTVATSRGEYSAPLLIDASGWRAVLAPAATPDGRPSARRPSVGIEVREPGGGTDLHFWLHHPAMRDGYIWDFPAGDHRRVGVITYGSSGKLKQRLEDFMERPLASASLHGGGLPARLPHGVADERILLVGDSAGQCLPLTGEGIRPALVYGQAAGRLARRVLAGELSLPAALAAYQRTLRRVRPAYTALALLQGGLGRIPSRSVPAFAWLFGAGPLSGPAERAYWAAARPERLSAARSRPHAAAASSRG
jgi:flavin-dependent dehydrogenase